MSNAQLPPIGKILGALRSVASVVVTAAGAIEAIHTSHDGIGGNADATKALNALAGAVTQMGQHIEALESAELSDDQRLIEIGHELDGFKNEIAILRESMRIGFGRIVAGQPLGTPVDSIDAVQTVTAPEDRDHSVRA